MVDDKNDAHRETRRTLGAMKRLVVKLGTNVVTQPNGELALGRLASIIEELVHLHRQRREVILVSSGAVGLGAGRLGFKPELLPQKQACAAVGQVLLTAVYEQAFSRFGIPIAQILVTADDFSNRTRYLNLRNTFRALLEAGVIPVLNENDPVATDELEMDSAARPVFGDNDKLSALVASKMEADALLMLTNVDGLFDGPGPHNGGALISTVTTIDTTLDGLAGDASGMGRGGMRTKLEAAKITTESGAIAFIANGRTPNILTRILSGEPLGTIFLPKTDPQNRRLSSRKRWIAFAGGSAGHVCVTDGAREALETRGASLLFAGVTRIDGSFTRGDIVTIADTKGDVFARGMSNHSSEVATALIGKHTTEVAEIAAPSYDAFISRDNLVLTKQ